MPGKRISFKQRVKIQCYIEDPRNKSLSKIASILNLSRSTIYREIINRRVSRGSKQERFLKQKPLPCQLLKQFPFCCNACCKRVRCAKEILIYDAYDSNENFEHIKHTCAQGPQLSTKQLNKIDEIVSPRILSGQSIYHVVNSDKDINVSEQTIRRYIRKGYLHAKVIDLPRTVQRRNMDYVVDKRVHVDAKLLNGRMYEDYLIYIKACPEATFLQIDTMIGRKRDKKCILTIFEPKSKLQVGLLINRNSESINSAILKLIYRLEKINTKFFDAILTDNGSEFKDLPKIEVDQETGVIRFKLFFCDPYASYQKGGCERNHEFFRYIKRKGISFDSLTQLELDNIFSNINSYKRKSLNGKTPFEEFKRKFGLNALEELHIHYVEPLQVILKQ